jgi:DMSO/TMAO reductase YedYZ molybdopterin-dependent catalytic subunit
LTVRSRILLIISLVLLLGAGFALVLRYVGVEHEAVITYDEITSMPAVSATYHSINNWATVEDTDFTGVPVYQILEKVGATGGGAQVEVIAPDGYFWPALGDTMDLDELRRPNPQGLYPMLAWEMNGEVLQPEPDGSGPLRLVMPQYGEEEVNKPSWVSNVRLIQVGPLEEEYAAPSAGEVPLEEVWLYGNVPAVYPFPLWPVVLAGVIGLLILGDALLHERLTGKGGNTRAVVFLLVAVVLASSLALAMPGRAAGRAAESSQVFSASELQSMPAFSGHYTFLKSQEPYTYYEADYEGVPLSYLLQGAMQLEPGAQGVVVRCTDGYKVDLSLSQASRAYPGDLKAIVAYAKGGSPLAGDEGPLRLIVPQANPGDKNSGGDANTPSCARMVYAVEVTPLPAGFTPPSPASVPAGSLAVYGAVTVPAPPAEPVTPEQPATPQPGSVSQDTDTTGVETPVTPTPATGLSLNGLPNWASRLIVYVTLAGGPFPLALQVWIASGQGAGSR